MSLIYNRDRGREIADFSKEKNFLFKLDNTLQNSKQINVQEMGVSFGGDNIAMTDLSKIYLNFKSIQKLSNDDYFNFSVYLKGFNYHELAHIIFTKYGKVGHAGLRRALNILEDQRIETLFSEKYLRSRDYFRMLSVGYILKDGFKQDDYLLLYGRRFIIGMQDIMDELREICVKAYSETKIKKAEAIIDKYLITLNKEEQLNLAKEFFELFPYVKSPQEPVDSKGSGKKSKSKDEEDLTNNISEKIEKGLEEIEEEENNSSSNDYDEEQDDASESDDSSDDFEDSDEDLDEDSDDSSTTSKLSDGEKKIVKKLMNKSISNIKEEIENQMKSMDKHSFDDKSLNNSKQIFSPEFRHYKVMNELKIRLKKIRNDLDNRTIYNQKKGKVNMRKAVVNSGYKTNDFKRFIPSRLGKTKLGVAILIDSSGSMRDPDYETALSSGWAVANALESCGSKVKVYEFSDNDEWKVLKDFNTVCKDASWGRNFAGWTFPAKSFLDAEKSLDFISKKDKIKNQMVIIITDGKFASCDREIVEQGALRLRKKGIYVALLHVGHITEFGNGKDSLDFYITKNKYNKVIAVKTFEQLTGTVTEMVADIQQEIVRKVKIGVY